MAVNLLIINCWVTYSVTGDFLPSYVHFSESTWEDYSLVHSMWPSETALIPSG